MGPRNGRRAGWRPGVWAAWMSGVGERRELSKFENFETHVLDLGLNGRGVDVYGLLWGY